MKSSTTYLLKRRAILVAAFILFATAEARAQVITWVNMSPIAFGATVPSPSVFNVPGIGDVTVTHSLPAPWTRIRQAVPGFTSGNVGPYTWSNFEQFSTYQTTSFGPEVGTVTFTFPTRPAGTVFVGALGLGATTNPPGGASTTTVNNEGFLVGEYIGSPTAGTTDIEYGSNPDYFILKNSDTAPGGVDPHWNTNLAVVRIDDIVSSITLIQSQLGGDGMGGNIGFLIPIDPECEFNNCKATKIQSSMVRAFAECGGAEGNTPDAITVGGVQACAPPEPLSLYKFRPNCGGTCKVTISAKADLCGEPPAPCCCIKAATKCKGILAPDASDASGVFSLSMLLRLTGNDPVGGGMTAVDMPFVRSLTASGGEIKDKGQCIDAGMGIIPRCSAAELVDLALIDPDGDRFAVQGVSCCNKVDAQ